MKNRTKFLDDIMANSVQRSIVIDVTDKPTFEDWWRFEEECLSEHFGFDKERNLGWWNTYFVSEVSAYSGNNFILLEINVVDGEYVIDYLEEAVRVDDFDEPYADMLILPFSEIYNKYLLKPLSETLVKDIEEQPKEFNHKEAIENLLKAVNKPKSDAELLLEEQLNEVQEEIEALNSTIKDMEEIIKRYEHNLTFVWTMLEQKIKEK